MPLSVVQNGGDQRQTKGTKVEARDESHSLRLFGVITIRAAHFPVLIGEAAVVRVSSVRLGHSHVVLFLLERS